MQLWVHAVTSYFYNVRLKFYSATGDVFSVHAIENPSLESELELLRHFGPSLSDKTLRSVVQAFSQLRSLADQGMLNYPYSTREVINVVKHLEVKKLSLALSFKPSCLIYGNSATQKTVSCAPFPMFSTLMPIGELLHGNRNFLEKKN